MMGYRRVVDVVGLVHRRAILAMALLLSGCGLSFPFYPSLTPDDFRHAAARQGDFDFAFANCEAAADVILFYGPPVEGEEYRERANASDRSLVVCMKRDGYPYRPKEELLLPWHD
ncbi:MAG: hypothetical protein ISP45_03250 [Reyranella sp.]|nr:hypothetical protein [Reyranella sp.]